MLLAVSLRFRLSGYVMDRNERKKQTRKTLCQANRQDRLISGYVKFKYPEVYAEALACYQSLDALYPNKRDLSKTIEYIQLTTGAVSYTQYYNDRKAQKKQQEKPSKTTTTDMALRIELLSPETVASQATLDIPESNDVLTEIMQDQDLRVVFDDITTTPDGETDTPSPKSLELEE